MNDKGVNVYYKGKVYIVPSKSIPAMNRITASLRRMKHKI